MEKSASEVRTVLKQIYFMSPNVTTRVHVVELLIFY